MAFLQKVKQNKTLIMIPWMLTIFLAQLPNLLYMRCIVDSGICLKREGQRDNLTGNKLMFIWKKCRPRYNIVLLKTHKTASSAVQNILMRYGWLRGLNFALVQTRAWPFPFQRGMIENITDRNIFFQHIVYNRSELRSFMPANSIYITILRDPGTQIESWYNYYAYDVRHFPSIAFEKFIQAPQHHIDEQRQLRHHRHLSPWKMSTQGVHVKRAWMAARPLRNMQLFDLGLVPVDERHPSHWNADLIRQHISTIENDFHLVMVMELFSESLILLKDLLCWYLVDLVTFLQNARQTVYKTSADVVENLADHARNWSLADATVHRYFTDKLRMKIRAYGEERMRLEVRKLERLTSDLFHKCVQFMENQSDQHDRRFRIYSPQTQGYRIRKDMENNKTCQALLFSEHGFTRVIAGRFTNETAKLAVPPAFNG